MSIVKNIIQDHINNGPQLFELSASVEGQQYYRRRIDWQTIEQKTFEELKNHIDTHSVDRQMLDEIIAAQIQTVKESKWFSNIAQQNSIIDRN